MKLKRNSIQHKVLFSISFALISISLCMVISNIYSLIFYKNHIEYTIKQTLQFYTNHWNNELDLVNKSLRFLGSSDNNDVYYNLSYSKDELLFELSKIQFKNEMDAYDNMYNGQFQLFCYIPDKEVFLHSESHYGTYNSRKQLEQKIMDYINSEDKIINDNNWILLSYGSAAYFVQIYKLNNGYIGASIPCKKMLEEVDVFGKNQSTIALLNAKGELAYINRKIDMIGNNKITFSQKMGLTDYSMSIIMSLTNVYGGWIILLLIAAAMAVYGIGIVLISIHYQRRIVIEPLNRLRKAMDQFSEGNTGILLNEDEITNEMRIVNNTFNKMTEQITNLRIDNYERQLENQEIQYHFLQVQIQPHFYANILNLIYGLAEIRDYDNIQKLSQMMVNYFRHLLNSTSDFISLENELDCIENYLGIQQVRYPNKMKYRIIKNDINMNLLIPPIIVQTFVENCVKHNITLVPHLFIKVTLTVVGDEFVIQIEDNGRGFPIDVMERLNADIDISHDGKQIGIVNVKRRISMLYKGKARLIIINKERCGTRITISIPKIN